MKRYLDVTEVAERLGVPVSWVYRQVAATATDPIPVRRFGRLLRFPLDQLEEWERRHDHPDWGAA